VTSRCNARCGFCAWNPDFYSADDELSTDEVKSLYSQARAAGFVALTVWGGEPLVRRDIGELLEYAKGLGFFTNVVTNGAVLHRKADVVMPHVDRLAISLDHPSPKHDEMRKIPGLYFRIVDATRDIKQRYPDKKVLFNYTFQKSNADAESIEQMAQVARSLGVSVLFNAMRIEAASTDEVDLEVYNPSDQALHDAFEHVRRLKRRGFPVVNSNVHIGQMKNLPPQYRCHWPKVMLPIEANGDVVDCMRWGTHPIDNVRERPLAEILKNPRLLALAGEAGEACHKCVSVHRIDISHAWEGRLEPLLAWSRGLL
jgi:pyrroloquinoline quinone biosynthesis protein E